MLSRHDIEIKRIKVKIMAMSRNRLQAIQKAEEAHRQSMKKSVEHRLQVAKSQGDENLIRQLEAEQAYYQ
ncbi:MAG: hypothetical protein VKL60_20365 [Sphaerospermopsis sp.]|nr:hypothetical protein [Sphaerospermopsis sp.]